MNTDIQMIVGVIISGPGTLINLVCFVFSGLEFGFVGNSIFLVIPFIIGFSIVVHSMQRTLDQDKRKQQKVNPVK